MRFEPPRCPHDDCPSITSGHRRWCFKGRYPRACDGRTVQRFLCLECHRTFSTQTFRVDYRLKLPRLNLELIGPFVSKVTHPQAARILGCPTGTVKSRCARGRHRLVTLLEETGITGTVGRPAASDSGQPSHEGGAR